MGANTDWNSYFLSNPDWVKFFQDFGDNAQRYMENEQRKKDQAAEAERLAKEQEEARRAQEAAAAEDARRAEEAAAARRAAEQAAQAAAAEAARQSELNALMLNRQKAETTATDYVDSMLQQNASRAGLFGMKFSYTPEQRTKLIENRLADLWSADSDTRIAQLGGGGGVRRGKKGVFDSIDRASPYKGQVTRKGGAASANLVTPVMKPTALTEDEAVRTLNKPSLLGV